MTKPKLGDTAWQQVPEPFRLTVEGKSIFDSES